MTRNIVGRAMFLVIGLTGSLAAQAISPDWAYWQEIQASGKGLTKIQIPAEALSNARPDLADLRLLNSNQQELSFFIDRPSVEPGTEQPLKAMNIVMEKGKTILTGEVPKEFLPRGFDAIYLYSPTDDFLKPITVEASVDKRRWDTLVKSYPIFKQPGQMQSITVEFPKINLPYLRITLDDSATSPIRVQNISLYSAPRKLALQSIAPKILDTTSDAHQSEIRIQLPAANLIVDSVKIETSQTSFKRMATVATKVFAHGDFREQTIGHGPIYRVPLADQTAQRLYIPIGAQVPSRELTLRIENADNLPLSVNQITVDLIPAFLIFDAPGPGQYRLLLGNPAATPKSYDLTALRDQISRSQLQQAALGPLVKNPAFKTPDTLPQIQESGSEIDIAAWQYRKKIELAQSGLQRLELDLQALAHDENRLVDIRLVRNGKQLPFILDRVGVLRESELHIESQANKDKKSRWTLTMPIRGMPISSLKFKVQDALFQRSMAIYEEVLDERGDKVRQDLCWGNWTRVGGQAKEEFVLNLSRSPRSEHLILETDNGDNSPIHIFQVRGYYQAPRIFFKSSQGGDLYLYYGQAKASMPQYDVNLVASEVLSVQPYDAKLSSEEVLQVKPWWELPLPSGGMKYLFWATLGLVMAALLYAIVKLLPAEAGS